MGYQSIFDRHNKTRSVFLGDDHSKAFWDYNHKALRAFKPDYLLLEVIGSHRYLTQRERQQAKKSDVYIDNTKLAGYNSDAFKLADDLNVPMIGIDVWDKPYQWPEEWEKQWSNEEDFIEHSHRLRESQMVNVAKEFVTKGKCLLIVGAEHLRDDSALRIFANNNNITTRFFKL